MANPLSNSVGLTGDSRVDGLLQGGKWSSNNLTYSLWNSDFGTWNQYSKDLVTVAFRIFEAYTNLKFTYQETYGNPHLSTDLEIVFSGDSLDYYVYEVYGAGIFPDTRYGDALLISAGLNRGQWSSPEGAVFLDNYDNIFQYGSNLGGLGFQTLVHEIGHALGLKHPHDNGGNNKPTFSQQGLDWADNHYYTMMSYNEVSNSISQYNPATPMLYDVLALQHLYGANTSYETGDNTYNYYDDQVLQTLWDAGGNDTIQANTATSGVLLNLNAGSFSQVGNTWSSIAFNVTIENAIGSNYSDAISGNEANNSIRGLAGEDNIDAGAGNDTVYGGYDVVDPYDQADLIQGGAGSDTIYSNTGDDTIYGGNSDYRIGDTGDLIYGGYGSDVIYGQSGNDSLYGGGGKADPNDLGDTIDAGDGDDYILANGGNDQVNGSTGDDTIHAGLGDDNLIFAFGHGQDIVPFFQGAGVNGGDTITFFASGGINNVEQLLAKMSYSDGTAFFDLGEGNSITIQNLDQVITAVDIIIA